MYNLNRKEVSMIPKVGIWSKWTMKLITNTVKWKLLITPSKLWVSYTCMIWEQWNLQDKIAPN